MKKIIITGATGFIGSTFIHKYHKKYDIIAVTRGQNDNILEDYSVDIVNCDLKHISQLPKQISGKVDACLHLAWSGIWTKRNDYEIQVGNLQASSQLIDVLVELGVKSFIGAGSRSEMEVPQCTTTSFVAPPEGFNYYSTCKMCANMLTNIKCNSVGINHIWCRMGNTYGECDNSPSIIHKTIELMLKNETVTFRTTGEQLFDFVHITDVVDALSIILDHGSNNNIYYVGSGNPKSLKGYVEEIKKIMKSSSNVSFGLMPSNSLMLSQESYDIKEISKLGYCPKITFEEGVKRISNHK